MARTDFENSPESGQPVSLFLFKFGPGATDHYAYTNAEQDVVHDTITYSSIYTPDQLDDIESKQKQNESEMKIRMPLDSEISNLFISYPPTQIVTLVIREGHIPNTGDPGAWALGENFPVAWMGRVLEVEREDEYVTLVCDNTAASMRRPGLRSHFQYPCRHVLYRGRCGAVKASFTVVGVVSAVSLNRVTITEPWVQSGWVASDYARGRIEWTGTVAQHHRTILRVENGNELVLSGPATDLSVSDNVSLSLGCPKTLDACRLRNAQQSFGGFIGIPSQNPTGINNHT